MTDITSIFDDDEPVSRPSPTPPPSAVAPAIDALAHDAVRARDEYDYANRLYEHREHELMQDVEQKLAQLKANRDAMAQRLEELSEQLQATMTAEKIDAIPLPDRAPIELKVIPGRKKQPTKGFLVEQLGKATAEVIWKRLPSNPDVIKVSVPSRNDSPPSD